ncbi:DUF421 domain-containing protein [Pseudonocardia nigra]|uniref:DUF421 domain-containing protein n=1 Tax=Pseudonocardia nigra TaxID=1921578 RepID=UPI001C5DE5C3|nr:YetF domain-containing protein [Pseudonocardia nigra]
MDAILRAAIVYVALLVIFRVMGKRALAQVTTFDLVVLLIVSEATQQALLGEDYSISMAVLVVLTLVGLERIGDYVSWRFPKAGQIIDGAPVVLIDRGTPLQDRMRRHHIRMDEILQEARTNQGLRSADEIDYAVLERSDTISIVPKQS